MTAVANNLAIDATGVTKAYGKGENRVVALAGADLRVPYGELVMLVGPSGCGKTTLISILAGLLTRDGGSCSVLGVDPQALRNGPRTTWRGRNVGFVFQQFNLVPTVTAQENVAIPLLIQGTPRAEAMGRAGDMLRKVGLCGRERSLPPQMSGGQQQRVAIARALAPNPRLLVCDEPTSALDGATGQSVMELVARAARENGHAVVVITHDERIFRFANRIVHMDDGRVTRTDEPLKEPA
ncbi:MAG: ABC transporter ATP-binding protein [Phycisphaerae bacterium]|nr:ABC transporter ATP-binding protein [Phycisphaerae bacterium]